MNTCPKCSRSLQTIECVKFKTWKAAGTLKDNVVYYNSKLDIYYFKYRGINNSNYCEDYCVFIYPDHTFHWVDYVSGKGYTSGVPLDQHHIDKHCPDIR